MDKNNQCPKCSTGKLCPKYYKNNCTYNCVNTNCPMGEHIHWTCICCGYVEIRLCDDKKKEHDDADD